MGLSINDPGPKEQSRGFSILQKLQKNISYLRPETWNADGLTFFLGELPAHRSAIFGGFNIKDLLDLAADEDSRVGSLRLIASSFNARPNNLLIRYKHITCHERTISLDHEFARETYTLSVRSMQ